MGRLSEFFNEVTNDGRIFSFEDVANLPQEGGSFYQKALDYQYGKIGFPKDKELQNSSDVVYVRAYTRDDGTEVRAHYRSKNGHNYIDPNKRTMTSPKEEKARIEEFAQRILDKGEVIGGASKVENAQTFSPLLMGGVEYNNFNTDKEFLSEPRELKSDLLKYLNKTDKQLLFLKVFR